MFDCKSSVGAGQNDQGGISVLHLLGNYDIFCRTTIFGETSTIQEFHASLEKSGLAWWNTHWGHLALMVLYATGYHKQAPVLPCAHTQKKHTHKTIQRNTHITYIAQVTHTTQVIMHISPAFLLEFIFLCIAELGIAALTVSVIRMCPAFNRSSSAVAAAQQLRHHLSI